MVMREKMKDGSTRLISGLTIPEILNSTIAPEIQIFTTDGTWNKADGARFVEIEVLGGGGGGGGAGTAAASQNSAGSGGGAGGYAWSMKDADDLAASEPVTVGVGGTAVANTSGGNGGGSSFGTHVVVGGGTGGIIRASNGVSHWQEGGAGGTATVGDLLIPGESGVGSCGLGVYGSGGQGGNSKYGSGGRQRGTGGTGTPLSGYAATGYGAGGGGALCTGVVAVTRNGGVGAPGIVIVKTYFQ